MLTEEEQKELKKLSPQLRERIIKVFESPNFNAWYGVRTQLDTICAELINKPKQIEEDIDYEKFKEYDNADKIIQAISATSRGKSETSLKWMKEIQDLVKIERAMFADLTPDEQKKGEEYMATAKELRNAALGKK
jgi:hypothetical protein